MSKIHNPIVAQKRQPRQSEGQVKERSPQKSQRKQPSRYNHTAQGRSQVEPSPYLQIQNVPIAERVNPRQLTYVLIILPQGLRVCGGQFTAQEAHAIAKATRRWHWDFDENKRLRCLPALEALLDDICTHCAAKQLGGENFSQSPTVSVRG